MRLTNLFSYKPPSILGVISAITLIRLIEQRVKWLVYSTIDSSISRVNKGSHISCFLHRARAVNSFGQETRVQQVLRHPLQQRQRLVQIDL